MFCAAKHREPTAVPVLHRALWRLLRGKASELLSIFQKRTRQKVLYFMDVFVGYVTAFFQDQLIIAVSMGALYAISFTLIGLEFGVLVGLVLGLLNIIPFLGTLIGLLVVLPMAYLQPDGGVELLALAAQPHGDHPGPTKFDLRTVGRWKGGPGTDMYAAEQTIPRKLAMI